MLITMDQLPLPQRRASARTAFVRDIVSFDEWSHKLATFAAESFGRLVVEGSKFVGQLVISVVGGKDGSMRRKGTPTPNRLGDHTGRHLEEGVAIQTPA